MRAVAAGSATGNKHISHIHSTPVTVQMASPGREAGGAMKKDEQSDAERSTEVERQRKGGMIFFMRRLVEEVEEMKIGEGGLVVQGRDGAVCTCLCNAMVTRD